MDRPDWPNYVQSFHAERAGITEDVLEHARDSGGATAYDWAAAGVLGGTVLDIACGSAPMASRLLGRRYVGFDLSEAELHAAAARAVAVVRADASRLPLPDRCVDAVVMSMALMLVPLHDTLSEVRRVLRPGGVFVATVPSNRPMPAADWLRYARLCVALRHPGLRYPNDELLSAPADVFAAAGLLLVDDTARVFLCDLASDDIADQLLASLYLPDVAAERMDAGRWVVRRWVGSSVATPIRKLTATA